MTTEPAVPATRSRRPLVLAVAAAVVLALAAAAFLLAGRDTPPPVAAATTPPAGGVPVMADGRDYFIGLQVQPGVYRQRTATAACTWKVTDPITSEVIEESLAGAPGPVTVNLGADTKFRSEGCGAWVTG